MFKKSFIGVQCQPRINAPKRLFIWEGTISVAFSTIGTVGTRKQFSSTWVDIFIRGFNDTVSTSLKQSNENLLLVENTGWCFGTVCDVSMHLGNNPNWQKFLRKVETTNQNLYTRLMNYDSFMFRCGIGFNQHVGHNHNHAGIPFSTSIC